MSKIDKDTTLENKDVNSLDIIKNNIIKRTASKQEIEIYLRDAESSDINFIFSSWLKSGRHSTHASRCDNSIYFSEQHKLIERLLKTGKTLIASEPKDPTNVYGYVNYDIIEGLFVLHFAYVKQTFRGLGIFSAMLKQAGHSIDKAGLYTHNTDTANKISTKFTLVYHPYILINYIKKVE